MRPLLLYTPVVNRVLTSVGSVVKMEWNMWSFLLYSYRTKSITCLFAEMPFNTDTPNLTASAFDNYQMRTEQWQLK